VPGAIRYDITFATHVISHMDVASQQVTGPEFRLSSTMQARSCSDV
jgi:hypothetical protein